MTTVWRVVTAGVVAALVVSAGACDAGPRPIAADEQCAYCGMAISDPRFGAELVTRTGKVHTFDSIECLASYAAALRDSGAVRGMWVTDFRAPTRLIPATHAVFLRLQSVGSPMGRGLASVPSREAAVALLRETGASAKAILSWSDVLRAARGQGGREAAQQQRSGAPPEGRVDVRG